jgi:hypothetical protein
LDTWVIDLREGFRLREEKGPMEFLPEAAVEEAVADG